MDNSSINSLPAMPDRPWNAERLQAFKTLATTCYQAASDLNARVDKCKEVVLEYNFQIKKNIEAEVAVREHLQTQDLELNAPVSLHTQSLGNEIKVEHLQSQPVSHRKKMLYVAMLLAGITIFYAYYRHHSRTSPEFIMRKSINRH